MTHCKYILPDGRPVIAVVPFDQSPRQVLAVAVSPGDVLWPRAQRIPGTERRFVLAERARGL